MKRGMESRIAGRIMTAAGFNRNISKDVLEWCKEEMKSHAEYFEWPYEVWSNDGNSYDGYISFTEGDATCTFFIDGWELDEIHGMQDEFSNYLETCKSDFVSDNMSMFYDLEIEGYGKFEGNRNEMLRLLDDDANCPEEIRYKYDNYESDWMSEEYGLCNVQLQFRNNQWSADEDGEWNVRVYVYVSDEYDKNKKYIHEESFNFNDGEDPRPRLKTEIDRAFKSITR